MFDEEGKGYEDEWERQGATYEQTLMAFQNTKSYETHRYHKHNYSKNRKRRNKLRKKRKRQNNFKKIEKSFGKPMLSNNTIKEENKISKNSDGDGDGGYTSDESIKSNISTDSITSNGSGKGSITSILSDIQSMPSQEWIRARLRAMKDVFMLAWPIFLTSELLAMLYFVNLLWIGRRYSADQLAGASLACTMINIVGQSLVIGMSSSLDTLCGQSYGAESYDMVGIYLQRMIALIHLLIIVIAVLFIFSQQLLEFLQQPSNVAMWSGKFAITFIIALWPLAMWYCLRRYLQSQGKVKIIFPSVIFAVIGQWIGLYLFDIYLDFGFTSAAMALGCAYWFQFLSMLILIFITGSHTKTWPGWKLGEMFKGWKQIFALSIPSLAMLCSEWWAFEMQALFSGWVSDDALAGFALSLNFLTMTIKIPLSISWANGIVVAQKLGKMRPDEASAAWDGSLCLSTLMTAIISLFCWFGRSIISHLYAPQASHENIRNIFENCLMILAIYMMIDQVQRCGQGAIRGMGMQKIGAYTNILSYYCLGIPTGLYLCFKQDMEVRGLWFGMCIASLVSSIVFIVLRYRINWREQVKRAFARIQEKERKLIAFKKELQNEHVIVTNISYKRMKTVRKIMNRRFLCITRSIQNSKIQCE